MTKEDLIQKLINIFFQFDTTMCSHPYIRFYCEKELYSITYGKMYAVTGLEFEHLLELSELFGTKNIKVEGHTYSGCETCDYGSDYGYTILIRNPTNLVDILNSLHDKQFDDKELKKMGINFPCK